MMVYVNPYFAEIRKLYEKLKVWHRANVQYYWFNKLSNLDLRTVDRSTEKTIGSYPLRSVVGIQVCGVFVGVMRKGKE